MKRKIVLCLTLFSLTLLIQCGGGTSATVKVGSIPNSGGTSRTVHQGRSVATDALQSTTEYAFGKVDGIKLNLTRLQVINGSNESDIISWSPAKEVIIAPGTDNTIALTETATVSPGSYTGVKVRYENSYSIKAFCRTATKFVYTTAGGVSSVAVGTVTSALPSDYDYYAYPFAELTTSTSTTGGNPETMAQTDVSLTLSASSSLSLAILFDPSYLVTCYDGTTTVGSGNTNALSPFIWTNNNGLSTTDFFPNSSPNFGMGYVPIFIWATTDASELIPTAETYASSTTQADVNGATIDYNGVSITSFAFKSDGSILDARTRIASGGGSAELQQFFSAFTMSGRTSHSMKNGEWYCDADYSNCRVIEDRSITGFTRTTDFTSTSSSTYGDGDDCGETILDPHHPEWGNRARECLGSSSTMYWRQLTR